MSLQFNKKLDKIIKMVDDTLDDLGSSDYPGDLEDLYRFKLEEIKELATYK